MGWMQRDECGLLYDLIACALGVYNMVRERLIPLSFFVCFWKELKEMGEDGVLLWPIGAWTMRLICPSPSPL